MKSRELVPAAQRFAAAQRDLAGRSDEDFQHWHHAGLADLLMEMTARIEKLESAIDRYLADSFSCQGGAQRMFEIALSDEPLPDFV